MSDNDADISEVQNVEPPPQEKPVKAGGDMALDDMLTRQAKKPSSLQKISKKQIKMAGAGVGALLIILLLFSCQPKNGPMTFGICSAFLELNTPYPHTLQYNSVDLSQTAVRIYFTNVDPFGQFKQEMIECGYGLDSQGNPKLTQVSRNRRAIDQAIVEKFNVSLPTIVESDPYRVMPPNWKNPLLEK